MKVRTGVPAEAVNQAATHTLFVEGSGKDAIDPEGFESLAAGYGYHDKIVRSLLSCEERGTGTSFSPSQLLLCYRPRPP